MGANVENQDLLKALDAFETLKARGFTASCGPTGGVVLDRWNHVHGVWYFHEGNYFWTGAGSTQPSFRTERLSAAIEYTMNVIAKA